MLPMASSISRVASRAQLVVSLLCMVFRLWTNSDSTAQTSMLLIKPSLASCAGVWVRVSVTYARLQSCL